MAVIKFYLDDPFRIDLVCSAIPLYHNKVVSDLGNQAKLIVLKKICENQKKSKKILLKDYNKS